MRHLISLVVVLLVSVTCKGLERKEIAISNLSMVVKTTTEQTHWLYGAADFVSKNDDKMNCDGSTMDVGKIFTISNQVLYIDKDSDDEVSFKIMSCTFTKSKVFADAGLSDTYRFVVKPIVDGKASTFTTFITIEKVNNAGKKKTIVTIPAIDEDGRLYSVTVYTK